MPTRSHFRSGARALFVLLTSASALAPTPSAQAAEEMTYTYVNLGVLGVNPVGVGRSTGVDVNDSRRAAGGSTTTSGANHAYSWSNGALTDLGTLHASPYAASTANGLNNAGDIVGHTSVASTEPSHAFLHRDGTMVDLGTGYGSGSVSSANDVNDHGQVVGVRAADTAAPRRAVLWENGSLHDLGTLGGRSSAPHSTESEAHAINDKGQVVGSALPESGAPLHGFVWENGVMRDLGTLGGNGEATQAFDINDAGQVVGVSQTADLRMRAFLWEQGRMRDLGALGEEKSSSFAYGINGSGQVVGASDLTLPGQNRAFLWSEGRMTDLNTRVTNLPGDVLLSSARAIADDGTIVGTTCSYACPLDKGAPTHAFMLVPHS